jgi:thiol:disulfide interchange protein DsbD
MVSDLTIRSAALRCRLTAAALLLLTLPMASWPAVEWKRTGNEPLPASSAFRLLPARQESGVLHLRWDIAPGYFLYRDRLKISVAEPTAGARLKPKWPTADSHSDGDGGTVAIYRNQLDLPIVAPTSATRLLVRYQGCADAGLCYPPIERIVAVTTP